MILRRIVEFAERQESSLPSGYQKRFVTKIIDLDAEGNLKLISKPSGASRGKRVGIERAEPQESPMRTVGIKARLVADNVNYVLGKAREKDKPEQVVARHEAWCKLVAEAAESTHCAGLRAIHQWVLNGGPETLRDSSDIDAEDDLTFRVNGKFPTDAPEVRAYWANQGEVAAQGTCLVTGQFGPITDRMPAPIKGVPDGQMSGTALVSVNNAAGESYGLTAALNSPISPAAAEKLCNGLNLLINERVLDSDREGRSFERGKYSLRVGKALFIAWTLEPVTINIFSMIDRPHPDDVRALLNAVKKGRMAAPLDETKYFVVSLSANAARIAVREYHELTLGKVNENYAKWFSQLELAGVDGDLRPPIGVYALAASLYRDASKEMPKHVPTDLVNAAINGRPFPQYLLGLAVRRNFAMQGPFTLTPAKTKVFAYGRLALIKAVLTKDSQQTNLVMLNTEHPNPAYHYGRLLAVLEAIQRLAIPKLNATLVDRHYGAACTSPASVFANLVKDSTIAHLPKLRKSKPGAHSALESRLREIMGRFDHFSKTLTLEEQGLFSLGYYHQRADDIAAAIQNKEMKELADAALTTPEQQ